MSSWLHQSCGHDHVAAAIGLRTPVATSDFGDGPTAAADGAAYRKIWRSRCNEPSAAVAASVADGQDDLADTPMETR